MIIHRKVVLLNKLGRGHPTIHLTTPAYAARIKRYKLIINRPILQIPHGYSSSGQNPAHSSTRTSRRLGSGIITENFNLNLIFEMCQDSKISYLYSFFEGFMI